MVWFMLILACNVWSLNVTNRDIETSTQELLCTTNLTLCSFSQFPDISCHDKNFQTIRVYSEKFVDKL